MKTNPSIIQFLRKFPSEKICRQKFKEHRDRIGVICPKCRCKHHYWLSGSVQMYQCKCCGYRQSLKANTVMHHSRLSFRYWFIAIWLIANTKNAFSAAEIQRQLGHRYYRPIFNMMHKIRSVMGQAEQNRILRGEVEIDECLITTKIRPDLTDKTWNNKSYKQKKPFSHTKTKCVVMCESFSHIQSKKEQQKYKISKKCGNLKMVVIDTFTADDISNAVVGSVDYESKVWSDATRTHRDFPDIFREYISGIIPKEDVCKILPFVHITIGNLKAQLRNIHHSVDNKYLQFYIDEFVWKFNHRYSTDIFGDVLDTSVAFKFDWTL